MPREPVLLVARAFGGDAGWEGPGSPYALDDPAITHQVVDRPGVETPHASTRAYIQPQWIFDSANFRVRADERRYAPGTTPPPHLSPFADADDDGGYVPEYAQELLALRAAAEGGRAAGLRPPRNGSKGKLRGGGGGEVAPGARGGKRIIWWWWW